MNARFSRRNALSAALFGGGLLGLRSMATGLPARFLLDPRRALADVPASGCTGSASAAQFVILNTSGRGDPFGCNAPGTYDDPTTGVDLSPLPHPDGGAFPWMAPMTLGIGGRSYKAAQAWSWLGAGDGSSTYANVLSRTAFCHLRTTTGVHPMEPKVLQLMGSTVSQEMFPSVLAAALAPCLGTLQAQPISVGASSPSEALKFQGQALPTIPPAALKATLANPTGPLTNLQPLRDATLQKVHDLYTTDGARITPAQKAYVDSLVLSQQQVRGIAQSTLEMLSSITSNGATDQITASIALVLMKVAPVIAVHVPFGDDNHNDVGLKAEATQMQSGMQTIVSLMQQLRSNGLADLVSFINLNVFGRSMGPTHGDGRDHNADHQLSVMIGKGFKSSVIGGVGPTKTDYGCLSIDSTSGLGKTSGGDIAVAETLPSWAKTVMAGVGIDTATTESQITAGKVIPAALA